MSRLIDFVCSTRLDDDSVDRLHRRYTVLVLVSSALLVSALQLFGHPVTCWPPAHFTDQHVDYGDSICWNRHSYFESHTDRDVSISDSVPRQKLTYFKWVPFVLVFQALVLFVPCLTWRFFYSSLSGINVAAVVDAARVCLKPPDPVSRQQALQYIVNRLDRFSRGNNGVCSAFNGFILVIIYPIVKMSYAIGAIGQVMLIDRHILTGSRNHSRLLMVDRLVRGVDWPDYERFPLVTSCEFEIKQLGQLHKQVVQCHMTINDVNQKLFIFFWFWFLILAVVTFVSLAFWLFRAFYWAGQVRYVRNLIWIKDATPVEISGLNEFARRYLSYDGMFLVRLIGNNVGEVVVAEVLNELWKNRSGERQQNIEWKLMEAERSREEVV